MMPYWPFQQYEAERAKNAKNAKNLGRSARAVRHRLVPRKPRPECGRAQIIDATSAT
jgi:hypothetical protein